MASTMQLLLLVTCLFNFGYCSLTYPSYQSNSDSLDNSEEYLVEAVVRGDFKEVLRIVQSNSSMANAQDRGKTALGHAIDQEDLRMIRLLLQYGADANAYVDTPLGGPPSFGAVEVNNTAILKLLLEYCSSPRVYKLYLKASGVVENRTLLEVAERMHNQNMVDLINEYLEHGCGRCPAERRFFSLLNINWWLPETPSRNVANISCPISYGTTFGTWRCGPNSTWDEAPDLSPCEKVQDILSQDSGDSATAADNLTRIADVINSVTLLPGDLLAIDRALKDLQSQHINHDLLQYDSEAPTLTKKYLTALVNVTGKMLEEPLMWEAMPQESAKTVFTDMQENVVNGALTAAQYQVDNVTEDYPNEHLHLRVSHQPSGYYYDDKNRLYNHLTFPMTNLQLPERFFNKYVSSANVHENDTDTSAPEKDLITVIFSSYRDLHCISNVIPCNPPSNNHTRIEAKGQVNSGVIGAKVGYGKSWQAEGDEIVEVTFKHIYDGATYHLKNPKCVWWNTETNVWSSQGCELYDFTPYHTICHCRHLTNLAIIMDINGLIDQETVLYQTLQWITIFGCSLSILSLVVCICCFLFLKKVKTKKSSSIRANLCICLLLAELVLLLGLNATSTFTICKVVAALLHYLFLATFTWSAIEAFNLYLVLVKVFDTQSSLRRHFLMVGYGGPLLFVGATLFITKGEGYGTDKICWLAPHRPIWIFAGSLAFIITLNLISFVLAMRVAWREQPVDKKKSTSSKSRSQVAKRLSGSAAIFIMLGLTWVTGFFYMAEGTEMLSMLFTILNSLQGFGIFVFGVLLDDLIRKEAKESIAQKIESQKMPAALKGTIIPQRRGSYNFTDSEESSRVNASSNRRGSYFFTESEEITMSDTSSYRRGSCNCTDSEGTTISDMMHNLNTIEESLNSSFENTEDRTKL